MSSPKIGLGQPSVLPLPTGVTAHPTPATAPGGHSPSHSPLASNRSTSRGQAFVETPTRRPRVAASKLQAALSTPHLFHLPVSHIEHPAMSRAVEDMRTLAAQNGPLGAGAIETLVQAAAVVAALAAMQSAQEFWAVLPMIKELAVQQLAALHA
jgi:hypothetical protein